MSITTRVEHGMFKTEPDRQNQPNWQKPSRLDSPSFRFWFFMIFCFGSVRCDPKPTKTHMNRTDHIRFSFGLGFSWFSVFGFVGSVRVGSVLDQCSALITTNNKNKKTYCSPLIATKSSVPDTWPVKRWTGQWSEAGFFSIKKKLNRELN